MRTKREEAKGAKVREESEDLLSLHPTSWAAGNPSSVLRALRVLGVKPSQFPA
jgi:hypothetical protein